MIYGSRFDSYFFYFTLKASERKALTQFCNTKTRIYFILQLGYFKARQQLFNFSLDEVISDVLFIVSTYYSESAAWSLLIHREGGIAALNIIRADQKDFQYTAVKQ